MFLFFQFEEFGNQLVEASLLQAKNIYDNYNSVSQQITISALETNQQWPFVTLDHFSFQVQSALKGVSSQAESMPLVMLLPLVTEMQRSAWEAYSISHQGWIQRAWKNSDPAYASSNTSNNKETTAICPTISQSIDQCVVEQHVATPYYTPLWQLEPIQATNGTVLVNYNAWDSQIFATTCNQMIQEGRVVLSNMVVMNPSSVFPSSISSPTQEQPKQTTTTTTTTTTTSISSSPPPHSFLVTPVYPTLDGTTSTTVAAVLAGFLPWHIYFQNILPEGIPGIVVVIQNCNHSFTYDVDGPTVLYRGMGDFHDANYDPWMVHSDWNPTMSNASAYDDSCSFTLQVYPSQSFVNSVLSSKGPAIYTIIVVSIFLVTSGVFLLYGYLVVDHHRHPLKSETVSTNDVASSIAPGSHTHSHSHSHGHHPLNHPLPEDLGPITEDQTKQTMESTTTHDEKSMDLDEMNDDKEEGFTHDLMKKSWSSRSCEQLLESEARGEKPMAELFPNATVMFGDISGFTAWSSEREPSQVFTLLESVYSSLDKVRVSSPSEI